MALTKVSRGLLSTSIVDNGNATAITIDSSENVGIGITSGLEKFTVANTSSGIVGRFTNNTNQTLDLGVISGSGAAGGVYYNSANSGYHAFQTGGTERMRITSAGRVGIGTDSPDTGLDVATTNYTFAGTTYDIYGLFGDTSGGIRLGADSSNDDSVIGTTGTNDLQFVTYNGSSWGSRMTLSNTGNVGIGTSSPSSLLEVMTAGTAGTEDIARFSRATYGATVTIAREAGDGVVYSPANLTLSADHDANSTGGNSNIKFKTDAAERMRIDSSGNLLVGKSGTAFGTAGIEASASNGLWSTRSGFPALALNRLSTDGSIADFYKDGTNVGSIGSASGVTYFAGPNSSTGGFRIDSIGTNGVIVPTTTVGANRDAALDLGMGSARFKDLHLSGTAKAQFLTTTGDSLWFLNDLNATGNSYINYYGYNQGVTQFRNLYIANGKGANILQLIGDTKAATFYGSLSKASGSFKIDHPLPEKADTHHLVHSFVESPQADNIYRGKVELVDGSATVNIDDAAGMTKGTYVLLNTNTQCFTSNESGWTAVKGSVSGNILTITAQDSCSDTISWMVVGERHDQHMLDTEWTDENGKVIVEPLKLNEEE